MPRPVVLVDAQHSAVGVLGQHGVAAHVAVVLLGDEGAAAQVRTAQQRKQCRAQLVTGGRPRQVGRGVGVQRVLAVRTLDRALVHRALVRHGARRHVDDGIAVPGDLQPVAVGDLADDGGQHLPLAAHRHERLDVLRRDDRAHALLRFAGEHLGRRHIGRAQRHRVQLDPHAAVARGREFRCGARQPGPAEILDADHQAGGVQLQAALDEHLLHERVADLDRRQLLAAGAALVAAEGLGGQHRHPADTVQAGARAEQDDLVAGARGERQVQILFAQHADAQRVHQRIAGVGRVEHGLAADVGQAQRVAVSADPAHHTVEHAAGVGRVGRAEAQLVHHRDGPGAHRHDVADDAADAGGGTLIRLDIRRVVVRFHLEGHRPAVADVDDAGVLADTGQHRGPHRLGGGLAEVAQVHLGRLVGAVLAPHHRVHRQLGVGRAAAQDLADALVLVVLEAEFAERLRLVGGGCGVLDGVDRVGELRRHEDSLVTGRT